MFYSYKHTLTTGDIVTVPKRIEMPLANGVIHQVDILFQSGCLYSVGVQIWRGGHQVWPSNRGNAIFGDASVVSFREFEELKSGDNDLYALIWGDGIITGTVIIIQIGVLPKAILQPMSFDELIKAATG